jgi:hypothetical protein
MTDEKLGKEISDLQTKSFHLQDRIKSKTHNTSCPPSERPKGFDGEWDYLMADKFDCQKRLDALKDEKDFRERWPRKEPRPKCGQAWNGANALIAQIKKSEFRFTQDSRKTSLALEHQHVKSTPATTTRVNPDTMISARVSLPELTKAKKSDFKIFDDEAPKDKTVEPADEVRSSDNSDKSAVEALAEAQFPMIQKVLTEEDVEIAKMAERDAKKAEYAELRAIRETKRQEALVMAGLQERRNEGLIARMERQAEEARHLREKAEAAALEAYNKTHASDKKPEPNVEPGTSTAPSSVNDYFDHISRRERNKPIRTSQPLSRVSVPPQGYTVVKGSPLLHGKPSHVTLEHNTTTKHIGVPSKSSSSAQASERKTDIQRPTNTGSYLPISRVFEHRNMSNTHKDLPKLSCPTRITPQQREYTTIREPFRQNVEQSRISRAMNDREIKLNDLKKFADSFKLHTNCTREPFTRPEISKHKTITSTAREISPPPTRCNLRQQKPKQIFLSEADDEWQNMSNTIQLVPVDPAESEWEDVDMNLDVNATAIERDVEKELEVGEEWILVA